MGLVEERLLNERNWKNYCSTTRLGLMYKNLRNAVYGENVKSICRVCGATDETVAHMFQNAQN